MNYPSAASGLKMMLLAQILTIVGYVLYLIFLSNGGRALEY